MPALPEPGEILSGRYELVRRVGEGGMGVVYEGVHRRLGQRIAIKVLHPRMTEPAFVERFEREARAASRLKSRHTVRVIDVDETPGGLRYIVMEFLDGRDLAAELERRGTLPVEEAVDYVLQASTAMAEAHAEGIVHRDLKPANLFLSSEGGHTVLRVLDFGISKMTREGETSVTVTTTSLGTPLYMSPEQVRSAKGLDARTDIWSLAVIAYELLAGRTPFVGETPTAVVASIVVDEPPPLRDLRPDVPEEVAAAIHAALVKDPAKRTPDVQTFAEALVSFGPPGTFVAPAPAAPPLVTIRPPGAEGGASSVAATALSGPGSNAAATTPGWSTQRMQRQGAMAWAKLAGVAAGVVAIVAGVVALRARAHEIPQPSPAAASGSLATSATVIAPERPPESSAAPEPQPPPTTRTEEVPSGSSSSTPPALPRHPVTRPGTRPARSATVASPPSAVPPPPPAPTGTPPNHI